MDSWSEKRNAGNGRIGPVQQELSMKRHLPVVIATLIAGALLTATLAAQRGREGGGPAGAPPATAPQGAQAGNAPQGAQAGNAPQGGRGAYQPTLWWGDEMFPK